MDARGEAAGTGVAARRGDSGVRSSGTYPLSCVSKELRGSELGVTEDGGHAASVDDEDQPELDGEDGEDGVLMGTAG